MPPPLASTEPLVQPLSIRASLLRHSLPTLSACLLITLALTLLGQGRWDVNLVYSLAIGLTAWLSIEWGRFRFASAPDIAWPMGWRGVALVACGIALGFGLGSWIGRAYQAWAQPEKAPTQLLFPLLITIAVSAALSFLGYMQGKSTHMQMLAEQTQRQLVQAQLSLLQTQLEPHMLFNTLANLQALIATDPERAQQMLEHLIAYLRTTLVASRSSSHSLREEFARLHDYLALMAIRMGPRLRYQLDLPEALADLPMPPLLLQPLVENSIRHGLEPQLHGGDIWVTARTVNINGSQQLELSVLDNGSGLPANDATSTQPGQHFGTSQVRERLASRYGPQARFELLAAPAQASTEQGTGTLARITLPLNA